MMAAPKLRTKELILRPDLLVEFSLTELPLTDLP